MSEIAYEQPFYEEQFDVNLAIERTLAEFRAVSPKDADVLELRMEGLSWGEIADRLDLPYPGWPRYWPYWRRYRRHEYRILSDILEKHLGIVGAPRWPYYPWPSFDWPRALAEESIAIGRRLRIQLGDSANWVGVVREIYDLVARRSDHAFYLSDLERTAAAIPCSPDHVLIALGHLVDPPFSALRMELRSGSQSGPQVNTEEMVRTMRGWHRAKTVSDQAWQAWTSTVWVIWKARGWNLR